MAGQVAADLGCGPGFHTIALAERRGRELLPLADRWAVVSLKKQVA